MRQKILATMIGALEPLDFVLALWQGGSAAHHRSDEWSDLDVVVIVQDDFVQLTFDTVEQALQTLWPIRFKYRVPEPAWHGHSQTFYQLEGVSPFLSIDFAVMKLSSPNRFLERERHGEPIIGFDKANLVVRSPLNLSEHFCEMAERLSWLKNNFDFLQTFVKKEIYRGLLVDAIGSYHSRTLRPLIELLGIAYRPYRYDFMTKYFSREFPSEIVARVEPLWCITDLTDLAEKQQLAEDLFAETLPYAEEIVQRQTTLGE